MTLMLAQSTDLPSVPADTLKWVLVVMFAVIFITAVVIGVVRSFRDSSLRLADNPPPKFSKAAPEYNHTATEQRFGRLESRVGEHDERFTKMEAEANRRHNRQMFALGKIAQKMEVEIDPVD